MAQMLELSESKCKVTMINMLKALEEKVDNMQERDFSREMKTKRRIQMEMLEIKITETDKKYFLWVH